MITIDLKILFNSSDPRTVQLYSQAHELIELLFLGLQEYDPPWLDDKSIQELLDQKEDMCESGAAELLMPMGWFRPLVESNGLSLQTGKGLARTSGLSLTAITRRMLETGMRECIFVIWKFAHKPTEFVPSQIGQLPLWGSETSMDPPMRPRVEYFWRSPTVNQYIKKDKSVGTDTSVAQTFDEPRGVIVRGYDYLEIGKEPGCYLTESISVAFDGQERVMSLVYLDDREEEQRRLDFIS
ncbi:MAG: hypothetical protein JXB07_19760 [Anaerolineae bacterium]|nr:hypothetical protein [Anaerolineae bacterium]